MNTNNELTYDTINLIKHHDIIFLSKNFPISYKYSPKTKMLIIKKQADMVPSQHLGIYLEFFDLLDTALEKHENTLEALDILLAFKDNRIENFTSLEAQMLLYDLYKISKEFQNKINQGSILATIVNTENVPGATSFLEIKNIFASSFYATIEPIIDAIITYIIYPVLQFTTIEQNIL